jgi:hypothetical protein
MAQIMVKQARHHNVLGGPHLYQHLPRQYLNMPNYNNHFIADTVYFSYGMRYITPVW